MKVIVTGAKGFFGPGIVARLRAGGHDVIGASRRADADARFDLTNPDSCRALIRTHPGVHAIVHAAALAHVPPGAAAKAQCEAVNVHGTRNLAQAAAEAGITRFIFISSVTVYGDYDLPRAVVESTPAGSVSMYGDAKRRAEEILARHAPAMERWILRMATMYSAEWLFNVRKRVSPPLIGRHAYFTLDPRGRRYTLCSRSNGAETVLWAVEGRIPPGVYNVADRHVYSQADILRAVEAVEGKKPHIPIPVLLPRVAAALSSLVPIASVRENARSRYWKFCEHNVYPSDRLASLGLSLPPDLLQIGEAPPCR
jgi:nucleoside-diphosphate-sugar epimerase